MTSPRIGRVLFTILMFAGAARAADSDRVWEEIFSDGLVDAAGKKVSLDALDGKLVGIYFSAHWCPPCRAFTPMLVKFRDENTADFEVVFVSFDRSQKEKDRYMKEAEMKWPTVPFRAKSGAALTRKYHVRGIPTLVVLSQRGNLVSENARDEVIRAPDQCIKEWKEAAAKADGK